MKTFSQLIEQIGIDEATGDIWKNIQGLAQKGKGSTSFKFPGDSAKVVVTASDASLLVGAYLGLNKSNQVKFVEMIETDGTNYWAMVQWAKEMGVTHISVGESDESLEELNLDSLWQKFLKKIKMRPFDRSERARDKEETKKIRKYQKMVGITSSVEYLDEKMYDPMYYNAGKNNDANKDKFIKIMRKHKLTVITRGKTGTIEVFPKEGSDKQTIFKYAKVYGMIAVDEAVELGEASPKIKYAKIIKGLRDSQGPFSVVAIKNNKVVGNKHSIKLKAILPIEVNQMADDHPGATISIESKGGEILNTFKESVELDEAPKIGSGTMTFEFPDERKAEQFEYDISNSDVGTGKIDGKKVTVDVSPKWRDAIKKYLKKNKGKPIRVEAVEELDEKEKIVIKGEKRNNWELVVNGKKILTGTNKEVYDKAVEMDLGPRPNKLAHDKGTVVIYRGETFNIQYVDLYDVLKESVKLVEANKPQYKEGDMVKWKGKKGTIVRYDDKGPASPFYVVSFKGQYMSLRIPQHKLEESVQLDEKVKLTSLKSAVKYIEQAYRNEVTPNWKTNWKIKGNSAESQDWSIEKEGKLFNWEYHGEGLSNISSFMSADGSREEGWEFAYAVDEIVAWLADSRRWDESVELDEDNTAEVAKQVKQEVKKYTSGKLTVKSKGGKTRFIMVMADNIDNKLRKMILDIAYPKANVRGDDMDNISYGNISDKIISVGVDVWVKALGLKESTINEAETLHWNELDKDEREDFLKHAKLNKKFMTKDWRELDSRIQKSLQKMITKTTEGEFALEESITDDTRVWVITSFGKVIFVGGSEDNERAKLIADGLAHQFKTNTKKSKQNTDYKVTSATEKEAQRSFKTGSKLQESDEIYEGLSLSPSDKKVIDFFILADRGTRQSSKFTTDGKVLNGNWMGGKGIAYWNTNDQIEFNDLGSKSAETVQNYIRKQASYDVAESVNESRTKDAIMDVLDAIEKLGMKSTPKNIAKETKLNLKFVEDAIEFWLEDDKIESMGSGNRMHYMMKEEIANTSSGGGVSGFTPDTVGGDSRIMKMHRREKKKKKKNIDELEESIEKDIKSVNLIIRDNFCGHPVFQVTEDEFNKCKARRAKNERWNKYFDENSESGLKIKSYSYKNPSKPIIVQNERTGEMVFYRRRLCDNRLKHNVKLKRLSEQD